MQQEKQTESRSASNQQHVPEPQTSIQHGGFCFNVPSSWSDRSALVFQGPPQTLQGASLSGKAGQAYRSNLRVEFRGTGGFPSTDALLDDVLARARQPGRIVSEIRRFPLEVAGSKGRCSEIRFERGDGIYRQLHAAIDFRSAWLVATATTLEMGRHQEIPKLLAMIKNIELAEAREGP